MRDYNFRKKYKKKEQEERKEAYNNRGYFPSIPKKKEGDNEEIYYIEGKSGKYKKYLKKEASKALRKLDPIDESLDVNKGGNYKRIYELENKWY